MYLYYWQWHKRYMTIADHLVGPCIPLLWICRRISSCGTYLLCFPSHWYHSNRMSQGQSSKDNPSRHLFKRHGQATRGTVFVQNQKTEEIWKEQGRKIAELKNMMEKYFANTPQPLTDQQGVNQGHSSPVITNAGK